MTKRHAAGTGANPTMADIAKLAGVSAITVSRALRGSSSVREETRERICRIAREHGYRINISARNLRTQTSRTIAVVVEMSPSSERPMTEPYPLGLLGGITQELTSAGYAVLLETLNRLDPATLAADGVILLGQGAHGEAVRALSRLGTPLVVWGSGLDGADHVTVSSDNRGGGRQAAGRLLAMGRMQLAFLGDLAHAELAERHAGFSACLAGSGAQLCVTAPCDFNFNAGYQAMKAAIDEAGGVIDGVFAGSDLIAMGAVRALTDMGYAVPGDVSVIGFDDSPTAAFVSPAITTIRQDWPGAGRLLAIKALALIEGRETVSEELPTELVVRES